MVDETYYDPSKDTPTERVIEFSGSKMFIRQKGPYGFWYLELNSGPIAEKYSGAYTDIDRANIAAKEYIEERNKKVYSAPEDIDVTISPPLPPRPEIKYKKVKELNA